MTKSLMWLLDCLCRDAERRCGTDTQRDRITAARRVEDEGLSFLTITLPTFAQGFERALEQGLAEPRLWPSFHCSSWKGQSCPLPSFLRGLVAQVFDVRDGRLLDTASEEAIFFVRQICLAFKKVNLPCSSTRERKAFDAYIECEKELTESFGCDRTREIVFNQVASILSSELFADLNREIEAFELVPRHGPGATAERIFGNRKFVLERWHTRLEEYFPIDAYGSPCHTAIQEGNILAGVEFVEPGAEQPVKVISVPKTLSAPRIIAVEPVCMQYTQQALAGPIVETIERHALTAGHVNFHDQAVNRKLALDSSGSREYATLDLSEASDRVHCDLVDRLFRAVPAVAGAVRACRSTSARLVDGTTIPLTKFASMGSALCFPVESMVFFTICLCAGLEALNLPVTRRNVVSVAKRVYVYGDDIIVPVDQVLPTIDYLSSFGLKVNTHKSFWEGNFRESCGMHAYSGVDVTPVYVRSMPPCSRRDTSELVSYVSLANQLYFAGCWVTAQRVRDLVETILGRLPHVLETSPCLGWLSVKQTYSIHRYDDSLHRPMVKGFVPVAIERNDPLSGYYALMKFFIKPGIQPSFDGHLERSVRPGGARIKSRWAPPF